MDEEQIDESRKEAIEYLERLKFNLDDLSDKPLNLRQKYFTKFQALNLKVHEDHAYLDLSTIMNEMVVSFIAPAYYFNTYIKNLIKDLTWDEYKYSINEVEWISGIIRRSKYQADAHSVFLSIKMALDRLVVVFTYYYNGLSPSTTFGRYKDSGKATGLMSKVNELKSTDPLMAYIEKNYHEWIKDVVYPRDMITHYNDLSIHYHLDAETGYEFPVHIADKLLKDESASKAYGFMTINEYADNWYKFFSEIMKFLLEKELTTDRPRI